MSVWKFQFLAKIFGETLLCPEKQPYFLRNSDKRLLSPERRKTEIQFHKRKTGEGNSAKINICLNIHCPFFLFRASAFL